MASLEAATIVQSVLRELLEGILTQERAPTPEDVYLTEEDLFHHRNPGVPAQHWSLPLVHTLGGRNSKAPGMPGLVLSIVHEE